MSQTFRAAELWFIAGALAVAAFGTWAIGVALGSSIIEFVGFMIGACTFVPLPADAYVLNAAAENPALTIGVVGGLVNAVVVLVEREWILRFASHPVFDQFTEFIGTNRWVDMARRHIFIGLVVGGFSFLPFEPFRLVAVLRGYGQLRYALATFLGRGFRYYWLARVGLFFESYGIIRFVVWGSLAFFTIGLFRSYMRFRSTAS